ncbi:hypothetical protein K458DRAFT_308296 [Lentithecium fluviatile CBS 122367]|uniref:Putative gamma-glutamylcyclotransferase n=1 Tax=Lentithecium fluviatile CBS 122367 TaxID=1168545 RepID=A0A6G1IVA3_9PLEO|nr:hypothetical protein K458DRAFT_308296 [Lentithecium fluviatile CBS 122367]
MRISREAGDPDFITGYPNVPNLLCYMFFYGSLVDPDVICTIARLSDMPMVRPASITGFKMKMWGIYLALLPMPPQIPQTKSDEDKINGVLWKCTSEDQFRCLAEYETSAYTWCECDARHENEEEVKECVTFCWAGDAESRELVKGRFDVERWRRYFKASVTGKDD